MSEFNPLDYGPVLAPLLAVDRCRPLDAGLPNRDANEQLRKLTIESAFAHAKPVDRDMAKCCVSGVWLLHDFLDESHTISQGIDTASGSFWHAVMHRREGDFSNAKYWFRRVGRHPVLEELGAVLASVGDAGTSTGAGCLEDGKFDPFAFVDLCQAAIGGDQSSLEFCLAVQQAEWEQLFDHCYRRAAA